MRKIGLALLLLAPLVSQAQVGGFFNAGVQGSSFEEEDDDLNVSAELDTGLGIFLEGGIRFHPGLMAKLSYSFTQYDGGDVEQNGRFVGSFGEEVETEELRLGFYWAPPHERTIGWRLGVGYEAITLDIPDLFDEATELDGLYGEGALLIKAGNIVTFEAGGALLSMEDDDGADSDGVELRGAIVLTFGKLNVTGALRSVMVTTDEGGGDEITDDVVELRLTVGGSFGYPAK